MPTPQQKSGKVGRSQNSGAERYVCGLARWKAMIEHQRLYIEFIEQAGVGNNDVVAMTLLHHPGLGRRIRALPEKR
jgi:hypothetical protein